MSFLNELEKKRSALRKTEVKKEDGGKPLQQPIVKGDEDYYRVAHDILDLAWLDFDLGCFTL